MLTCVKGICYGCQVLPRHESPDIPFTVFRTRFQKGCSSGYNLARFPLLAAVNSQVNEQGNAGLQRITDQLSYINADNFMRHCSFYLWNKNNIKRQQLQ